MTSFIAKLITPDNEVTPVKPANGQKFSLEELQGFVGGYIQAIETQSRQPALLVINEEGKLKDLPFNQTATHLLHEAGGAADDYIVGPALLCLKSQLT